MSLVAFQKKISSIAYPYPISPSKCTHISTPLVPSEKGVRATIFPAMFMAVDDADHSLAYQHNFAAVAAYPTDCLVGLDGGGGGVVERSVQDHI
jgi:hypothetical protein